MSSQEELFQSESVGMQEFLSMGDIFLLCFFYAHHPHPQLPHIFFLTHFTLLQEGMDRKRGQRFEEDEGNYKKVDKAILLTFIFLNQDLITNISSILQLPMWFFFGPYRFHSLIQPGPSVHQLCHILLSLIPLSILDSIVYYYKHFFEGTPLLVSSQMISVQQHPKSG